MQRAERPLNDRRELVLLCKELQRRRQRTEKIVQRNPDEHNRRRAQPRALRDAVDNETAGARKQERRRDDAEVAVERRPRREHDAERGAERRRRGDAERKGAHEIVARHGLHERTRERKSRTGDDGEQDARQAQQQDDLVHRRIRPAIKRPVKITRHGVHRLKQCRVLHPERREYIGGDKRQCRARRDHEDTAPRTRMIFLFQHKDLLPRQREGRISMPRDVWEMLIFLQPDPKHILRMQIRQLLGVEELGNIHRPNEL